MQTVTINIAGADISVPAERAVHAFLREVLDTAELADAKPAFRFSLEQAQPKIGDADAEGLYAGRLYDGSDFYHLLLATKATELSAANWQDAIDAAAAAGWNLPTRAEALHLFERVHPVLKDTSEAFDEASYWTCQQHERAAGCAWFQSFFIGGQSYGSRVSHLRVRFVRRKVIQ
jgi:hypothetical protein